MTQIPMFQPPSEWTPPQNIPDLSQAKEIAIDLETNDIGINTGIGSGWPVKKGYVAGVAISVEGWSGYFLFQLHQNLAFVNCFQEYQDFLHLCLYQAN